MPGSGLPITSIQVSLDFQVVLIRGLMFILEPIGGAKPKFSIGTEKLAFTRNVHQQIGLLCPAQGFPLPAYR